MGNEIHIGNIKGADATITDVTASVDGTTGTPNVTVEMGGTPSKRSFHFLFSGLKGEKGDTVTTGDGGIATVGDDDIHINEKMPIYTEAPELETLTSGEKISVAFGKIKKAISELISHLGNKSNPHNVTASQLGLENVDNTSDMDKPLSTAMSNAISETNNSVTAIQTNLTTHTSNTSNPHGVTKAQVGLENVDNTSDANKPVSTAQATAIADAKKAGTDAQTNLTSHINDTTKHITSAERTAWNAKAPGGHGLGVGTPAVDNKSILQTLQMGGGFYQVANADDTPTTGDPSWINVIQSARGISEGNETGVQLAFYDWIANSPRMWFRNVFKGVAGSWVEMLHTGNVGNYVSSNNAPEFVSGSYTGTGTYVNGQETQTNIAAGQSSIQFPAYPRLVMIRQKGCHFWSIIIPDAYNDFEFYTYGGNDYSGGMCNGKVTTDFKLNWYAHKQNWHYSADLSTGNVSLKLRTDNVTTDNIATLKPFYQLNNEGSTYEYFAICY